VDIAIQIMGNVIAQRLDRAKIVNSKHVLVCAMAKDIAKMGNAHVCMIDLEMIAQSNNARTIAMGMVSAI